LPQAVYTDVHAHAVLYYICVKYRKIAVFSPHFENLLFNMDGRKQSQTRSTDIAEKARDASY